MQSLALEDELELALGQGLQRIGTVLGRPETAVPHLDRAAAILAHGNDALEVTVVERVVFHFDGQALVGRIEGRSLGDRPGLEDSVGLEPQIVMKASGVMLLDDVAQPVRAWRGVAAARLARHVEIPLRLVGR